MEIINYLDAQGTQPLDPGTGFSIRADQVHRLVNSGDAILRVVFSAPPAHLGDDRFFIPVAAK